MLQYNIRGSEQYIHTGLWSKIPQYVKMGAEIASAAKAVYDIGKLVAPVVAAVI